MNSTRSYGRKRGKNSDFKTVPFRKDLLTRLRLAITSRYTYENGFQPPYNQLGYGTCVANETASFEWFYKNKRQGDTRDVSRTAIYWQGKQLEDAADRTVDDGMQISDGLIVGQRYGYALESAYPYPTAYSGDTAALFVPVPLYAWITTFKFKSYVRVPLGDISAIRMALLKHGPIIGGLDFPVEFENPPANGVLTATPKTQAGGHCMAIIGFDDTIACDDGSKGALFVRNSWGPTWGISGGYAWMPYTVVETPFFFDEMYTIAA